MITSSRAVYKRAPGLPRLSTFGPIPPRGGASPLLGVTGTIREFVSRTELGTCGVSSHWDGQTIVATGLGVGVRKARGFLFPWIRRKPILPPSSTVTWSVEWTVPRLLAAKVSINEPSIFSRPDCPAAGRMRRLQRLWLAAGAARQRQAAASECHGPRPLRRQRGGAGSRWWTPSRVSETVGRASTQPPVLGTLVGKLGGHRSDAIWENDRPATIIRQVCASHIRMTRAISSRVRFPTWVDIPTNKL